MQRLNAIEYIHVVHDRIKNVKQAVKQAKAQIKGVHGCVVCEAHYQAIREHIQRGHEDV